MLVTRQEIACHLDARMTGLNGLLRGRQIPTNESVDVLRPRFFRTHLRETVVFHGENSSKDDCGGEDQSRPRSRRCPASTSFFSIGYTVGRGSSRAELREKGIAMSACATPQPEVSGLSRVVQGEEST